MNYWWEVAGIRDDLTDPSTSLSELVQAYLPGARMVEALNHTGHHDLEGPQGQGTPGHKAITAVGDAPDDRTSVARLVTTYGFGPVMAGAAQGTRLEPGAEPFGGDVGAGELRVMLIRF
ncbi:hypothetical protein [Streptomyces sp. NPDC059881]|uniref:hypothetical protein n=1 Tax=Streptomyces sp. NPDC059881 TaxID=3346986 RepID=UPI0036568FE8